MNFFNINIIYENNLFNNQKSIKNRDIRKNILKLTNPKTLNAGKSNVDEEVR